LLADKGAILYFSRQYDRAIEPFRYVLDLEPHFPCAHIICSAYVQKGMFSDALADVGQERCSVSQLAVLRPGLGRHKLTSMDSRASSRKRSTLWRNCGS
jgi:hypothetical protein